MSLFQDRNLLKYLFLFSFSLLLASCAAPSRTGIDEGLQPGTDVTIEVGDISKDINITDKVDVEKMMREALEDALAEKEMLHTKERSGKYYILNVKIKEYEMGNAFKRWLMPFYGSTVLNVECDIIDGSDGKSYSKFEHKQSIVAGGLFSIEGWKTIFDAAATDIATEVERRTMHKGGFHVGLNPWPENETAVPKAKMSQKVYLHPLTDQRPDRGRIGKREAAFKQSMGNIYFNRDVAAYLSEALQNELLAAGNQLTASGYDVVLEGTVTKFWVETKTTPLYWDVVGEIEVKLNASYPSRSGQKTEKTYAAKSTTRTYIWPTEEIVEGVLSKCVKKIMYDIRKDSIWSQTE
jgi:uncharacterized lipoprotein YajG